MKIGSAFFGDKAIIRGIRQLKTTGFLLSVKRDYPNRNLSSTGCALSDTG